MPIKVHANPSRISWSHFRTVHSIPGGAEDAQIHPEMAGLANVQPQRTDAGRFRLPAVTLTVRVNAADTMVLRTANKTNELLQHEQGHFDLLLLSVRALARKLDSLEAASVQELGAQVRDAHALHAARAQAIDAAYDRETQHSRNRQAQTRWNAAITTALHDPKASRIAGLAL